MLLSGPTTQLVETGRSLVQGFPELSRALDVRAVALERGIDRAVRPVDVAALAARPGAQGIAGLTKSESSRLERLVGLAIADADLRVQSTVDTAEAVHLLREGGRMRNVYDAVGAGVDHLFQDLLPGANGRAARELQLDMLGSGTTVYGNVRLGDVAHTPMVDPGAARRIVRRDPQLSTGSPMYGDTSLVLHDRVLDRASFAPRDSGRVTSQDQLGAREQLPRVLATTMAEHFQVLHARTAGSMGTTDHPFGPGGNGDFRQLSDMSAALHRILDAPDEVAVPAVRQHLQSAAMDTYYAEAAVRVADVSDVRAIHVRRRILPEGNVPDPAVVKWNAERRELERELHALGVERGIPVRFTGDPLP
ncbi:MAG: hypothetical protein JWM90_900 [Thermoleophilia bacterium]|nr:hypothetical protein [Thermoleophilia bacterium]